MPDIVYLKEAHGYSTKTELTVSATVEEMLVSDLKAAVEKKMGIPVDDQMLLYAGRVLKHGKRLQHYAIVSGVTVFVLKKRVNPVTDNTSGGGSTTASRVFHLLQNERLQHLLSNIFHDPVLVQRLLRGSPIQSSHQLINNMLHDPAFYSSMRDANSLLGYLESHSEEASLMESLLQAFRANMAAERGCSPEDIEEEELVDMLEQGIEEEEDGPEEEEEEEAMDSQEQMSHSQLYQHGQQQGSADPPPSYESVASSSASAQAPPTGITQSMLASALSAALSSSQSSSMSSLYGGAGAHSSPGAAGPSSLPARPSTNNGPSSLNVPPPASLSRLPSWPASSPSSLPAERSPNGPQSLSSHSASSSGGGSAISQGMLQQALQSLQTQPSSLTVDQQAPPPLPPPRQPRSAATHRFQSQIQQLRQMGISNEAACLHALEATGGDVEAAIGLLL